VQPLAQEPVQPLPQEPVQPLAPKPVTPLPQGPLQPLPQGPSWGLSASVSAKCLRKTKKQIPHWVLEAFQTNMPAVVPSPVQAGTSLAEGRAGSAQACLGSDGEQGSAQQTREAWICWLGTEVLWTVFQGGRKEALPYSKQPALGGSLRDDALGSPETGR
jgi:hypothetical protein